MTGDMKRGSSGGRQSWRRLRVFLAMPLLLSLIGCKTDLYTKIQEREANEMLALLLGKGVDAVRVVAKDGTSTIQVEEKQLAYSIDLLNVEGLPRQSFKNLGEVFKGSGLVASPIEERARYVYALSEELSRTISDIDGVLSARVHVVLPKNDLLRQGATPRPRHRSSFDMAPARGFRHYCRRSRCSSQTALKGCPMTRSPLSSCRSSALQSSSLPVRESLWLSQQEPAHRRYLRLL
ncbi:type III secretion system YscJ/HrcJ family lipoprotein [Bradyrhizobium japonicum]